VSGLRIGAVIQLAGLTCGDTPTPHRMNKTLLGLIGSLALATLLHALPPGVSSIPFSTFRAQFAGGDSITIQEVLATSPNLAPGDVVVVRGTYTLQSQPTATLAINLTTTGPVVSAPSSLVSSKRISAGSDSFELEYAVQHVGELHVTFYSTTTSFGGVYFRPPSGGTSPPPPTTTVPSIPTAGLASVPFTTSRAQFAAGDAITIQEVRASSPNLAPGDIVAVRGTYTLQSAASATLLLSLTVNAPGAVEAVSPSSRQSISGSGTFELAYEIKQPGALHISFYPSSSGSSFGGVYFGPPGNAAGTALVSPSTNTGLLGNLSIRSIVGPGSATLIAGVTVTDRERYVLIRAVGPTLTKFGVSGVLAKPLLSVYNANGDLVASTGSWSTSFSSTQRAGIEMLSASVGAFALSAGSDDAVLHLRLVPGGYTVNVSTGDGQSGVALMEVYASSTFTLPAP
jgi:hypothetical protein